MLGRVIRTSNLGYGVSAGNLGSSIVGCSGMASSKKDGSDSCSRRVSALTGRVTNGRASRCGGFRGTRS